MQQFIPTVVLLEDGEHFLLLDRVLKDQGVGTVRDTNEHPVLEGFYIEEGDITRTGQEHIGVIINEIAHTEVTAVRVAKGLEDRGLVVESLCEHLDHLFGLLLFLFDGSILRHNLFHPLFDSGDHLRCDSRRFFLILWHSRFVCMPLERAVITLADRMLYTQVHLREQFIHRTSQHHAQRTHIHAHAGRRTGVQELYIFRFIEQKIEILHFIVHVRRDDGVLELDPQQIFELNQRYTARHLMIRVRILAINGDGCFHIFLLVYWSSGQLVD